MSESIHGHEVMEMILAANPPLSRGQLEQVVKDRFGDAPRFHTCSAHNMTLDELLEFLHVRGKVVEAKGVLGTSRSQICGHD
jgi:probable metal-binding protein